MRKLQLALTICIIIAVVFAACSSIKVEPADAASVIDTREDYNDMFERIGSGGNYDVVYHKQTKVMYTISDGKFCKGVLTLLVNPDGTPMIYKEEVSE